MRLLVPAALILAAACSRKPEPDGSQAPRESKSPPASATPQAANTAAPDPGAARREVSWNDPPGWQKVPSSSSMRKATYKVPAAPKDREDGEMAVFYFGGEGGSTEANITRWIGQFPDAKPADVKRSQRSAGGTNQTIVEVEGTYASGMPGAGSTTPKSEYRLIGAVVETRAGPYFFKLTGPKNTVAAARDAFFAMLDSVKSG